MAYISRSATIVVDAILTKRGRQLLSSGTENFNISKFAVSDDQIDYSLQDLQTNISKYYILEPTPFAQAFMKYKLYTQESSNQLDVLNTIQVSGLNQNITNPWDGMVGITMTLTPTTTNYVSETYTFTINMTKAQTYPITKISYINERGLSSDLQITSGIITVPVAAKSISITKAYIETATPFSIAIRGNSSGKETSYHIIANTNIHSIIS